MTWLNAPSGKTEDRTGQAESTTAAAQDAAELVRGGPQGLPRRQRHSRRAQKARPKFPHASATKTTVTGKPQVTVFAPGFY